MKKTLVVFGFLCLTNLANSVTTYFFYSDTIEPNDLYGYIKVYCIDNITTTIDMNGGEVYSAYFYDFSVLNMTSGNISNELQMFSDSEANIISGNIEHIETYGSSSLHILGGQVVELVVAGGETYINGGELGDIEAWDVDYPILHIQKVKLIGYLTIYYGETHIYANNFSYVLSNSGEWWHGLLSGKWYDGTSFSIKIADEETFSRLILHYPEPIICVNPILGDSNNDCKIDFIDFAILASNWMNCNLEPQSACWE